MHEAKQEKKHMSLSFISQLERDRITITTLNLLLTSLPSRAANLLMSQVWSLDC